METEIYKITGGSADSDAIERAGRIIREGGLVGIPTETVYGLGASALSPEAANKIYSAKGRPSDNPLIVHISEPAEAELYAHTCELYFRLAERFMPGPLTVILPKRDNIPYNVTGGLDTVALRCPSHQVARRIIRAAGVPVAAPSANRSGSPSPTSASHVAADLSGRIDMIIDGGDCEIGLESTVIALSEGSIKILRPGAVTSEMLLDVYGKVIVDRAVVNPSLAGERPSSPGMKYKHYSPRAEVILIDGDEESFRRYVEKEATEEDGVFVDSHDGAFSSAVPLVTGESGSAIEQSRSLFKLLRRADDLSLHRIFIRRPPETGEYLALYNRLIRASAGRVVKL